MICVSSADQWEAMALCEILDSTVAYFLLVQEGTNSIHTVLGYDYRVGDDILVRGFNE